MTDKIRGGVVPYFYENDILYIHLMIPSNKNYGGIHPQIAKGVIDKGETIEDGSVREAEEEIGLKRSNINGEIIFFDMYSFNHELHIYIAEIICPDDFERPHFETGWSGWLHIDDAIEKCTQYQQQIIIDLKKALEK